jgi:hypothetical protein
MQSAAWVFETNVGYGQKISRSVGNAIKGCSCCIAFVTRRSIASLRVLTELHNTLSLGKLCLLVLDASDDLLVELIKMFGLLVQYD